MFSAEMDAGATLSFVTRRVTGKVMHSECRYDEGAEKVKVVEKEIERPVIVFFPNGGCLLMSEEEAEARGLIAEPELLNIEQINDTKTAAGKWKFAMSDEQRRKYWKIMEDSVIRLCTSRGGYPLDASEAKFSTESILFPTKEVKKGVTQ